MALLSEHQYHYFDVRGIMRVFDFDSRRCSDASMIHLDEDLSQRQTARFHGQDAI